MKKIGTWQPQMGSSALPGASAVEEASDDFAVGRGYGGGWELVQGDEFFTGLGGGIRWCLVEVAGDFEAGDAVFLVSKMGVCLAVFCRSAGEAVHAFVSFTSALFFKQQPVCSQVEDIVVFDAGDFFAGKPDRQAGGVCGLAPAADGAAWAVWRIAGADGLPEFHEGRVVGAWMGGMHEGRSELPLLLPAGRGVDRGGVVEEAGEDARDVGIYQGSRAVVGKTEQSTHGVVPDAGQGAQGGFFRGELAVVLLADGSGCGLQGSHAAVVAEAFPGAQGGFFCGGSEGGRGGKLLHPSFVASEHGRDSGLLQHDFAHEDSPGVGGATPRVVAAMDAEPVYQRLGYVLRVWYAHLDWVV